MFKSIKNLLMLHLREKGVRDLILVAIYTILVLLVYMLFINKGFVWVRDKIVWTWVLTVAAYTLFTAFEGYSNIRKSYIRLLLPTSISSVFVWELLRTIILFGAITLGLLFAVDMLFEHLACLYSPRHTEKILALASLQDSLFSVKEPLNYLPIVLYIAVLCHSVALLISTKMSVIVGILVTVVTFVFIMFLPSDRQSLIYPFISQEAEWRFLSIQLSWASRSVEYMISYLWLAALPIGIYTLSYFRIKEIEV